jgi:hypothetical protein
MAIGVMVLAIEAHAATQAQPYREEEITVANGPVTIACTLTAPNGSGPFPAAVHRHGERHRDAAGRRNPRWPRGQPAADDVEEETNRHRGTPFMSQ